MWQPPSGDDRGETRLATHCAAGFLVKKPQPFGAAGALESAGLMKPATRELARGRARRCDVAATKQKEAPDSVLTGAK